MKKERFYKITAISAFILIICLAAITTYKNIDNILKDNIFLYLCAIVGLSTILFILIFISSKKTININRIKEEITKKEQNTEQDEKIRQIYINESVTNILKDLNNLDTVDKFSERLLKNLSEVFSIVQGIVFIFDSGLGKYKMSATYAFYTNNKIPEFEIGEGISGQVAKNMDMLNVSNIPENYITVLSGLGSSSPKHLLVFPMIDDFGAIGIVEIATFSEFPDTTAEIYKQINQELGKNINRIIKSTEAPDEIF